MVTQELLREWFDYDPETGHLTWKITRSSSAVTGSRAGCIGDQGYRRIKIDGKRYFEHRLIWLHVYGKWPNPTCDHRNRIRSDNKLNNLREATESQNSQNMGDKKNKPNKWGFRGVVKSKALWEARISWKGKKVSIGWFRSAEEAGAAYVEASRKMRGGFSPV